MPAGGKISRRMVRIYIDIYIYIYIYLNLFCSLIKIKSVQADFYIPPRCNMKKVKSDAFRDMSHKLRNWRHQVKKPLKIQLTDTPASIRARVGERYDVAKYDPTGIVIWLELWCSEEHKVGGRVIYILCFVH
jgi:hypothetical protein